jgi:hypothetical protein
MEEKNKNIIEIVENDPELQAIINNMLENKLLYPGIFHPLAYLRDTDKIEA